MGIGSALGSFAEGFSTAQKSTDKKSTDTSSTPREATAAKGMFSGLSVGDIMAKSISTQSDPAPLDASNSSPRESLYDRVAEVESGGKYDAYNKGSKAYGKYQFIPTTAKWVSEALGFEGDEWKEPENQEKMMDYLTDWNTKYLEKKGIPITEETLWWAHNQGASGAVKLYKGAKLDPLNLSSNGGTDEESYKANWKDKFGQAIINSLDENTTSNIKEKKSSITKNDNYLNS